MSINVGKILIFGSTHGHERIGLSVIEELKKLSIDSSMVEFVVGNPEASKKNVPFIETDLNRAFPGKEHGTYEEMRAFELSAKIIKADLVIDIHSTNTTDLSDESALIVTSYNQLTKYIISAVNPPKVLHMKYKSDNALISQAKIGIAFEYGKDSSTSVLNAILYDIAQILIYYKILVSNPYTSTSVALKSKQTQLSPSQ